MCQEVNKMSMRLKIWDAEVLDESDDDQKEKILKARERFQYATSKEVYELLDRVYTEMAQCTKPYKVH
jgi:hypothetical protein